jgi:RimJ/RimL family protein N-acetyltransferase
MAGAARSNNPMRKPDFYLETPRLLIRPFTMRDLETLHAYRNDHEVARYTGWRGYDEEALIRFIMEMNRATPDKVGDWFQWAVEVKATGTHIGDVGIHRQEDEPQEAEIAYAFARSAHGHGYATEAVKALVSYLFSTLRLHRITALIYADNLRSIALVERLSFRKEAHFHKSAWRGGQWVDDVMFAVLEEEWKN